MKILLNNIELILKSEELDVSSANPFLDNDEDRLDNIFSVEIPIVGNEKALGYIDNIDVVKENEYTCEIISSISFLGVAIVTEVSTEDNKAILQIGYAKSNFNYLIKDKKMKDLDFGSIECAEKVNLQIQQGTEPIFITIGDDGIQRYALAYNYASGNRNYYNVNNLYFPVASDIKINFTLLLHSESPFRVKVFYQKNAGVDVLIANSAGTGYDLKKDVELTTSFNLSEAAGEMIRIYIEVDPGVYQIEVTKAIMDCTIFNRNFVTPANTNSNCNYCFPLIQNNEMMNQLPDGVSKDFYIKRYPLLNNIFSNENSFYKLYSNIPYTKLLAPCLKIDFILNTIFEAINYRLNRSNFDNIYKNLLVFSGTIIGDYKSSSNTNFYIDLPMKFELNKCFDNDILISDFLKNLYIVTGFFPIFDNEARSIKLVSIADLYKDVIDIDCIVINDTINYDYEKKGIIIELQTGEDNYLKENYNDLEGYNYRGPIATLTDVANDIQLNDCYYIISERKYYVYSFGKATESASVDTLFWKFVSLDFRLKKEDGKEEFVNFKSEIPIMVGVTTSILGDGTAAYQNINIPVTKQAIRINQAYETYENKFSNSFLINRGLRTKDGLGEYLYASADNFFGQTQSNEISLRVDGEYGIANRMYKTIAEIYKHGKKHTINGYMTAAEIQKLSYENLIYINKGVNILLSYGYKLTDNVMKEIELELIKI